MRRQNALTLISEIVEESDFSEAACNFAYVSDVQSLITKSTLQQFSDTIFWHKIEIAWWNMEYTKKAVWNFFELESFACARQHII